MSSKKNILISIIIAVLLELFINMNAIIYQIGNYKEIKLDNSDFKLNNMILKNNNFIVTGNSPSIEVKNINTKIKNISYKFSESMDAKVYYADEMFSNYKSDEFNKLSTVKKTNVQRNCYFNGKLKKIKIELNLKNNVSFKIDSFVFNKNVPININIFRIVLLFLITFLIKYIISLKYINNYDDDKKQKYIINIIIIFFSLFATTVFVKFVFNNDKTDDDFDINIIYSEKLTDSILNGHLYLDSHVSKELKTLKNPYDITLRKEKYLYDTVYYKGKYYVYFGILPSLILFVPYRLITGTYLSIALVSLIFQILSIIFMAKFYKVIINKYFKKVPFILYIFGLIFFIISNHILNNLDGLYLYNMISTIAFYLMIQGLYFMFKYDEDNKKSSLLLGSLSLSLCVACRPTMLFISLLVLPIILKKIRKKDMDLKRILLFILPYLIIGVLLMVYNYVRFNNVFEFGFKYQLTVNDSRKLIKSYNNIFLGIYYYIFNLLKIIPQSPYLIENRLFNYLGFYYNEPIKCSIASTIIPFILLFIPFIYNKLKKHKDFWDTVRNMLIIGIFLVGYESLIAGLVSRYMIDFAFLFNISSILIIFFIYTNILKKCDYKIKFIKIITILIIISITIQTWMLFN